MFGFETPYLDMYLNDMKKFRPRSRPTVLHQQTCPQCSRKLVNTYYSSQLDNYICKKCMDEFLNNKGR